MTSPFRSDFSDATKRTLAARAGHLCSNPDCRASTTGPQLDPAKALNVGVAAHITAASPGGPRFDHGLAEEKRCAPENGIWLCQTCAKLVDNDPTRHSPEVLRDWKQRVESHALDRIGKADLDKIEDKWVSAEYAERSGITQRLRDAGFDLVWASAHQENERVDLDGWQHVVLDEKGRGVRLKIRDSAAIGGYLVLLRKRRESAA